MYILDKGKNKSSFDTLNILYKKENVYIMDNHLAAIWCWSKSIDLNNSYSFLHIDRHDDLSPNASKECSEYLRTNKIKIEDIPISNLTDLRVSLSDKTTRQAFVWDNYINTFSLFNLDIFNEVIFSTQEDEEQILPNIKIQRKDSWYLQDNLLYLLRNGHKKDKKWIINLDIDYFFTEYEEVPYQYLTDEFIVNIVNQLKIALDERLIEVLTIAISPDCCGGWDAGLRLANLISKQLELDFNYN